MEDNKKKNPTIFVLVLLVGVLFALCAKLWIDKNNALELAEEYKTAYEEIKKEEVSAEEYQAAYNQLVTDMLNDAALAEKLGNLTIKVWNNAIWQKEDEESDAFTKENGQFVTDFNEALKNLASDESFSKDIATLSNNQQQEKASMKDMLNPPEGYENAFKALEEMYNSYIKFTNVVLNGTGSLESYSNDFLDADNELDEKYHAVEIYVK